MLDKAILHEIEAVILQGRPEDALHRLPGSGDQFDAEAEFLRGLALHKMGLAEQAAQALDGVIAADPAHARALRQRALIHYWKDEAEPARDLLERALENNPKLAAASLHLGHIARRAGDDAAAAKWYGAEIAARPDQGHAQYYLGRALARCGRFEEAREALAAFTLTPALAGQLRDGRNDILERTAASRLKPADPFKAAQDLQNVCGIDRTLLIGAGAGELARLLLRRGINGYAISGDAEAMAAAARLAAGHFFTGSADVIPFENAHFGVVALLGCLNPLSDDEIDEALHETGRVSSRWAVVVVAEEQNRDRNWWRRKIINASPFRIVPNSQGITGFWAKGVTAFLLEPRTTQQDAAINGAQFAEPLADDPFIGWTGEADLAGWRGAAIRSAAAHLFNGRSRFLDLSGGNGAVATVMSVLAGNPAANIATSPGAATDYARSVFGSIVKNAKFEDRPAEDLAQLHAKSADIVLAGAIEDPDGAQYAARLAALATPGSFNSLVILRAKADEGVVRACMDSMRGAFNLRRVVTESPERRNTNFTLHQAEEPEAARRAIEWATGKFGQVASVTLLFAPNTVVESLAALPWPEFNKVYGGIGSRPFMIPADREKLADLLEREAAAKPDRRSLWKAVVAALAEGYGLLNRADLDATAARHSIGRLARLEQLGLAMPVSPELIRWLMSIRRCQAMFYLAMGEREAARERFDACIDKDYPIIVPHLLRHVLDSRFYKGVLDLGNGQPAAATEEWREGVQEFIKLAARMPEHSFGAEFEFSENANLFVMGQMLFRAAELVGGKRAANAPFGFQIGIANASVPQVVDRFGDRAAVLGDQPQRLI